MSLMQMFWKEGEGEDERSVDLDVLVLPTVSMVVLVVLSFIPCLCEEEPVTGCFPIDVRVGGASLLATVCFVCGEGRQGLSPSFTVSNEHDRNGLLKWKVGRRVGGGHSLWTLVKGNIYSNDREG